MISPSANPVFFTITLTVDSPDMKTSSMLIDAEEQSMASVVLFAILSVADLVVVVIKPKIRVARATVNAISRTDAMSGDIPFIQITYQ